LFPHSSINKSAVPYYRSWPPNGFPWRFITATRVFRVAVIFFHYSSSAMIDRNKNVGTGRFEKWQPLLIAHWRRPSPCQGSQSFATSFIGQKQGKGLLRAHSYPIVPWGIINGSKSRFLLPSSFNPEATGYFSPFQLSLFGENRSVISLAAVIVNYPFY